jgi:hypothetical protein
VQNIIRTPDAVSGTGSGSGHRIRFRTPDPAPDTGSGHGRDTNPQYCYFSYPGCCNNPIHACCRLSIHRPRIILPEIFLSKKNYNICLGIIVQPWVSISLQSSYRQPSASQQTGLGVQQVPRADPAISAGPGLARPSAATRAGLPGGRLVQRIFGRLILEEV